MVDPLRQSPALATRSAAALRLHPLKYLSEGEEVVVGRIDTDSYGLFPRDGVELLRQIAAGAPLTNAAAWYERRYGEPVDIEEFVNTLRELDFVVTDEKELPDGLHRVRWQRLGRSLFSPPAWVAYGLLLVAALAVGVTHPRFLPVRGNVFFVPYLVVVEISLSVAQLPMLMLHEVFHVLAGRRLGLNASVRFTRRLYFVGFETKLDGLVVMPRRKRYLPMLAGMLADVLGICVLTLVAWLTRRPDGTLPTVGGFCLALAFTAVPRISWQFYFFLRTDIYHLVTTVLGCVDLHSTAKQMVANRLWALAGRRDRMVDEARWHPRDVRVARWYAPVFVAGYAVMIATLVMITVPVAWRFFTTAARTVINPSAPPARFWDAALLLTMTGLQLGMSVFLALRDRRRRRAAQAH